MGEIEQPEPTNSGLAWDEAQNRQLAEWLQQGISIGEIANRMGRTSGAIRSQAVRMAPADLGLGPGR